LAEKHFPDSKQIRHQSMALLAHARVGHEFAKKLETLRHDFAGEKGHARDIALGVSQSILLRADEAIE
jgi:hypothetical protein